MFTVVVCEKFGWTLDQFLETPLPFLDLIREKMKVDAQMEANAMKNVGKGGRRK